MDKFYPDSFDNSVKSAFDKVDSELISAGNWDAMQQVLDREMPVQKNKRRYFFWVVIVGLLMGTVLGYQYWEAKQNLIVTKKINHLKSASHITSTSFKQSIAQLNKASNLEGLIQEQNTITVPDQVKLQNEKSVDTIVIFEKENSETKNDINVIYKGKDTLGKSLPIDSVTDPVITPELIRQTEKSSVRQQTRWQWNLSFAPDFLLANMNPFYRPGVSVGMAINYQLSPNWAIRTGLLYNYTPVYESGQTYLYKPSPNLPAYNTLELKQVKGSLHIFEVPLAFRYTAKPDKKISFLGSVGLSSLFFVKQKLTYDLLLNGNTPLLWNSENDSDDFGESHVLSNLVLGTGISIKTKRNAVIEIEPVFKLPLEELGEGHNRLGTIAFYLHLKQPIFKHKK